jgi:meiotically up-regulated gene 157 (Mug157) protein
MEFIYSDYPNQIVYVMSVWMSTIRNRDTSEKAQYLKWQIRAKHRNTNFMKAAFQEENGYDSECIG